LFGFKTSKLALFFNQKEQEKTFNENFFTFLSLAKAIQISLKSFACFLYRKQT
jgi:hypothetical protein